MLKYEFVCRTFTRVPYIHTCVPYIHTCSMQIRAHDHRECTLPCHLLLLPSLSVSPLPPPQDKNPHGKALFEAEHKELLNSLYECPQRRCVCVCVQGPACCTSAHRGGARRERLLHHRGHGAWVLLSAETHTL